MASNYNSRNLPTELLINDNNYAIIRKKENISIQGSADNSSWKFEGLKESFDKFSLGISIHDIPGF